MSAQSSAGLRAERIAALLQTTRYGRSLRVLSQTGSTNDDARADARSGAPDGHVVVADAQHSGRGSHGRSWASPPGTDLYLSAVARTGLPLSALPPLTLAVGLAVADAAQELLGSSPAAPRPEVKWPNDVWLAGRKCAGVLVETETAPTEPTPVVVGIGLNVNRLQWPEELAASATSLRLSGGGAALERELVFARLLLHLERWIDRFVQRGGREVAAALGRRLALHGQAVQCGGHRGTLLGVSPDGALLLEEGGRVQRVISGRIAPA